MQEVTQAVRVIANEVLKTKLAGHIFQYLMSLLLLLLCINVLHLNFSASLSPSCSCQSQKKSLHLSLSWPVLPFKHPGAIWVSCHSHTCGHFSGIYLDASSLSQIKLRCPILLNLTSEMYSFTSWLMQCPTKLQITAITTCFMLVLLFITRFLGCTVNILFVNNEVFLHPVSFKSVINCIKFSTDCRACQHQGYSLVHCIF